MRTEPWVKVNVRPATRATLAKLASLRGQTMASCIAELLEKAYQQALEKENRHRRKKKEAPRGKQRRRAKVKKAPRHGARSR